MSKIKDPSLANRGRLQYEWAKSHMPILNMAISKMKKSKPLQNTKLGVCLQITKETSV
ncbi:MAG TPA: adenosylhomocysteinase, partial [Candidatus Nitrosotenuis sp.]|nr:adenosylhomocysteinase [Candidatus Nitrosotenuis sp.]